MIITLQIHEWDLYQKGIMCYARRKDKAMSILCDGLELVCALTHI